MSSIAIVPSVMKRTPLPPRLNPVDHEATTSASVARTVNSLSMLPVCRCRSRTRSRDCTHENHSAGCFGTVFGVVS
jgi:hypothetical protein